jgi:hypothetical protein
VRHGDYEGAGEGDQVRDLGIDDGRPGQCLSLLQKVFVQIAEKMRERGQKLRDADDRGADMGLPTLKSDRHGLLMVPIDPTVAP